MILAQMAQVDTGAMLEPSLMPGSRELVVQAYILFEETVVVPELQSSLSPRLST